VAVLDLIGDAWAREILGGEPAEWCAEFTERGQDASGVLARRLHPEIEILGGARMAVSRDGVRSDDEVPDLVL